MTDEKEAVEIDAIIEFLGRLRESLVAEASPKLLPSWRARDVGGDIAFLESAIKTLAIIRTKLS